MSHDVDGNDLNNSIEKQGIKRQKQRKTGKGNWDGKVTKSTKIGK